MTRPLRSARTADRSRDAGPAPSRLRRERTGADTLWFWRTLLEAFPHYGAIAVCGGFVNIFALALPFFTLTVYDRVIPSGALSSLTALTVGMAILLTFEVSVRLLRSALVSGILARASRTIDTAVFSHLLSLGVSDTPRIARRLTQDMAEMAQLRELVYATLPVTLVDLLFSGLFLAAVALIGGPLFLVPATGIAALLITGVLLQIPARRAAEASKAADSERQALLVESLSLFETIKAWGAEAFVKNRWQAMSDDVTARGERHRFWMKGSAGANSFISRIISVSVLVAAALSAMAGGLGIGTIIAVTMLSARAIAPAASLGGLLVKASRSRAALSSLGDVMCRRPEPGPEMRASVRFPVDGSLSFARVSFTYPEAALPSLADMSFEMKGGERVGVIGRAGSGKTTLARLALGLYDDFDGLVRIGGVEIRQFEPRRLRSFIGYCPQDCRLLRGTLNDNLVAGLDGVSREVLDQAAEVAGVADFARPHPQGFDMPIADNGANLSAGQRQAIALARALATRADLLLLDEPTSAMDSEGESRFVARLQEFLEPHQSLVVISHRRRVLDLVDRIIMLDGGRVVSDGPRQSVLKGRPVERGSVVPLGV